VKIIELIIDDNELVSGIDAISLVERPAIEENFIALKQQGEQLIRFKAINEEKRILIGACLVPDKPIYRLSDEQEEYYVYFTKDTVRRASELFFKAGKQNRTTLEHEMMVNGLCVVESWIVEDEQKDKSAHYNLSYPVGTWVISMKVENEEVWNEWVKSGRVKGFSVEGYFMDKVAKSSTKEKNSKHTKMKNFLTKIMTLLSEVKEQKFEQATLADGSTIVAESFEVGAPIYILTDGGQIPLPVGEYALEDGRTIVVSEEGVIGEIKGKEATPANPDNPPPAENATAEFSEEEYTRFKAMFDRAIKEAQKAELEALIADLQATKSELSTMKAELKQISDELGEEEPEPNKVEFAAKKVAVSPTSEDEPVQMKGKAKQSVLGMVMERLS